MKRIRFASLAQAQRQVIPPRLRHRLATTWHHQAQRLAIPPRDQVCSRLRLAARRCAWGYAKLHHSRELPVQNRVSDRRKCRLYTYSEDAAACSDDPRRVERWSEVCEDGAVLFAGFSLRFSLKFWLTVGSAAPGTLKSRKGSAILEPPEGAALCPSVLVSHGAKNDEKRGETAACKVGQAISVQSTG